MQSCSNRTSSVYLFGPFAFMFQRKGKPFDSTVPSMGVLLFELDSTLETTRHMFGSCDRRESTRLVVKSMSLIALSDRDRCGAQGRRHRRRRKSTRDSA